MSTVTIPAAWVASHEFACHSKGCAPPPAGSGGSTPGGQAGTPGYGRVVPSSEFKHYRKASIHEVQDGHSLLIKKDGNDHEAVVQSIKSVGGNYALKVKYVGGDHKEYLWGPGKQVVVRGANKKSWADDGYDARRDAARGTTWTPGPKMTRRSG